MSLKGKQLFLDIETLGTTANCVILSAGLLCADFSTDFTINDLIENSIYVKFDIVGQMTGKVKRIASESTLDWWEKQSPSTYASQVLPSDKDVSLLVGHTKLVEFIKNQSETNLTVWTRGELDGIVMDNIAEQLNVAPLCRFNKRRDIRTAIDIMAGTTNGYTDCKPKSPFTESHDPVMDCIRDAWMMKYFIST